MTCTLFHTLTGLRQRQPDPLPDFLVIIVTFAVLFFMFFKTIKIHHHLGGGGFWAWGPSTEQKNMHQTVGGFMLSCKNFISLVLPHFAELFISWDVMKDMTHVCTSD
jgi:hypothetical protein